ncbi:HAD family hydrolase [Streptosporangium roseum]|uniref:HAD-superfamily hydrolase, subfamily IA, variant 3 n=1 Tax=Streptosporangium roseum (strain ATCC 12428 / DSM 43021 / JCM 3005 / KCTC 9067 / NCIMB 10171 / NRRL 2505 / NI 9100) TaxID=479432 RepID=D2AW75_STRRD|nr:HAD family phosphatase [Streptosporangium roseum]ACZ85028.1 HAD-superfamily hydrolase, subfamily IA, variant 3 [Streptosporangium roseum DSM 43021]
MLDQRLRPTMPYAALVFDCDGTLVDTASANETAWRTALADWQVELDPAWYRARTGLSADRLLAELETETGAELDYPAVRAAALDAYQWLIHTVVPHPQVAAVAEAHQDRVPMAVASGGTRQAVEETLRVTGLRPLFDAVVTRDDVRYGKPAPDVYLLAARLLNAAPHTCVAYEDTDEGVAAALAAGMTVIDVRPSLRRETQVGGGTGR